MGGGWSAAAYHEQRQGCSMQAGMRSSVQACAGQGGGRGGKRVRSDVNLCHTGDTGRTPPARQLLPPPRHTRLGMSRHVQRAGVGARHSLGRPPTWPGGALTTTPPGSACRCACTRATAPGGAVMRGGGGQWVKLRPRRGLRRQKAQGGGVSVCGGGGGRGQCTRAMLHTRTMNTKRCNTPPAALSSAHTSWQAGCAGWPRTAAPTLA